MNPYIALSNGLFYYTGMRINFEKQRSLGYAGLALLRNLLIGKAASIISIFKEISHISETEKDVYDSFDRKMTKHNITTGYKIWSKTYDTEHNILIQSEEPVVKSILKKFTPGTALDAGCGTGRYSLFLSSLGHKVTGIDISKEMLKLAKKKNQEIRFVQGDLHKLPFENKKFDVVICGLAIHYAINIDKVINELTRVLRPGGHMIISSIQPWLVAMGAHAEFHDKKESRGFIKDTTFWHSAYINAFNNAALRILQCQEPKIETEQIQVLQKNSKLSITTMTEAFRGLPIAVIWVLEKPTEHETKKGA